MTPRMHDICNALCSDLEVLHVCDEHGPDLDKVTVLGVLHLNHAPRVLTTADLLAVHL